YEALSWCWGKAAANQVLRIHNGYGVFGLRISSNLKNALRALRGTTGVRRLWIDAVCINQQDVRERNQQVARMDKIYGHASNVCIWLGEGDEDSKLALDFIKENLSNAWEFDSLIQDPKKAKHWGALISLMKRPWFSRRWVVQEISLSPRGGTLYCGRESIPWQEFSDAVSLLVEVETATRRLSDMLKVDETFRYIPDFVGDISSLGASLLVYTTSSLFHSSAGGARTPLSSLEHLVCRLSMFEVTQPRDTIYALLAISTDTRPSGSEQVQPSMAGKHTTTSAPRARLTKNLYTVDYKLPVVDVFKDFVEFCIRNGDPVRALDIICRPWAPALIDSHEEKEYSHRGPPPPPPPPGYIFLPSWISDLRGAAFEMEQHPTAGLRMERQNADPLVGMPDASRNRNYSAAGNVVLDPMRLKFVRWNSEASNYPRYSMFVPGFILDTVSSVEHPASNGNIPYRWLAAGRWLNTEQNPPDEFWRTLVADRGSMGRNAPSYFRRACKETMRFKPTNISAKGGYLDVKTLINDGGCTIVATFLRRVQEVIWNRSLMRTKRHHLGLVRDDVRPGFKICILYGCSVPVILEEISKEAYEISAERQKRRIEPRPTYYRLFGECYVHGMMSGEAIAFQHRNQIPTQVFDIR
ncbi:HET-domain-containing protein, partial [Hyaloscypha variabilis F]